MKDFGRATLLYILWDLTVSNFGLNWAATWARLRPRVQTLSWPHISAVIKLATRQNRLQLHSRLYVSGPTFCMYHTSEILPATTCWSSKKCGWENYIFSLIGLFIMGTCCGRDQIALATCRNILIYFSDITPPF